MARHSARSTEEDKGMRQCAVNVISVCRSKGVFEFPPRCFSLSFFFLFFFSWPCPPWNKGDNMTVAYFKWKWPKGLLPGLLFVFVLFFKCTGISWTAESLSSFKSLFSNFSRWNVLLRHICACFSGRETDRSTSTFVYLCFTGNCADYSSSLVVIADFVHHMFI